MYVAEDDSGREGQTIRIAMVHSFYSSSQPSGENAVVLNEIAALRRAGHSVALFSAHTDALEGEHLYRVRSAFRVATGYGRHPLKAIRDFSPDVLHVHNLFPNFARRWVEDVKVPLAHTVHNYRPICVAGTLYREGSTCTLCPDGDRWAGVRNRCYRDSSLASLAAAVGQGPPGAVDCLHERADALIMLTELEREIYRSAGWPVSKVTVSPNFVPDDLLGPPASEHDRRNAFTFVGRLSEEKGISDLVSVWPENAALDIIGDGPLLPQLQSAGHPSVRVLGALPRAEVLEHIGSSKGLVFPSRWVETFGLVYIEALAMGVPTLAFDGNTVARMVREEGTGSVASWSDPLAPVLKSFSARTPEFSERCRRVFEQQYSEASFVRRRESLFESLLSRSDVRN
jgi:glycosyltransferase involved in cell wall biosynthesis